ncbi:MAG: T9SS type A sorting domain-containing protein [Vicingaceae bacterium]
MKRLVAVAGLFFTTLALNAQLQAPQLNSPSDMASAVDVNTLFTWSPALGGLVFGYELEVATDSLFTAPMTNFPITGTGGRASELDFGQMYYWRVRAKGSSSTFSPWSDFKRFTTFLNQFVGLAPSGADKNPQLSLTWDTIPGVTSYTYEVSENKNFTSSFGGTVNHPVKTALLTELKFNTTYFYRVRASHSKDISGFSSIDSFSTRANAVLSTPANAAINQNPATDLVCLNTPGITSFRFQIDNSPAFDTSSLSFKTITLLNSSFPNSAPVTWLVSRLEFNQMYYWRVQGVNKTGVAAWTATRSFKILDKVLLTSPVDGASSVPSSTKLTWEPVIGADQYEVQVDLDANFTNPTLYYTQSDTSNHLNYSTTVYGTPINWRVRAIQLNDTSTFSDIRSFSTTPVGIVEPTMPGFNILPNPAKDQLTLQFTSIDEEAVEISFYNALGALIHKKQMGSVSSGPVKVGFDVADWNPGVYIVMIDQGSERRSQRLVIQ